MAPGGQRFFALRGERDDVDAALMQLTQRVRVFVYLLRHGLCHARQAAGLLDSLVMRDILPAAGFLLG